MTKELEALSRVQCEIIDGFPTGNLWVGMTPEELEQIKSSIQRLESIDNANPSEALECLKKVKSHFRVIDQEILMKEKKFEYIWLKPYDEYCDTIKQALLKSQENESIIEILKEHRKDYLSRLKNLEEYSLKQEKVLEIVFKKNVDISILEYSETVDDYNNAIVFKFKPSAYESCKLTQEEFDTLKEALNEKENRR